jgi:hypothetical protein
MSSRILYRSSGSSRSLCGSEPAPPMLRMLPALPMDKIEPALPMLRMLPKLIMLPTLPKLIMLSKLLALSGPTSLPARDIARVRLERADLCMLTSSVLAATQLSLPRRGSLCTQAAETAE